ncbi:MAG: phosphonate ABC transporter ATP-binding protein [Mycoplasma sp.]|nr:phosphonate ABC transporter ATP-binding protein [Mycoplasma sp.]
MKNTNKDKIKKWKINLNNKLSVKLNNIKQNFKDKFILIQKNEPIKQNKKYSHTIKFKNVNKVWPNKTVALSDINLEINPGEFAAVIGLSGAGKTTLIKSINGLNIITSGSLFVDGIDISKNPSKKKLKKVRKNVGIVFQRYNLVGKTSVLQNVLNAIVSQLPVWRQVFGIFTKEEKERALKALAQTNMLKKAYVRAEELSGGQMQRVALSRTIVQNPHIILADEPVGALDPIMAKSIMDNFQDINKKQKITIIANLHHVDLALKYATRIIGVKEGKIIYDGKSEEMDYKTLKTIYGDNLEEEAVEAALTIIKSRKRSKKNA